MGGQLRGAAGGVGMVTGEPRVLLSGLAFGESPRWHDGLLWVSDWGAGERF